jgi:hypothetical protein
MFRYNSGSASSYKWEFIGGSFAGGQVATAETTASTSYVDLATTGPSLALPYGGDYDILIGYQLISGTAQQGAMSYAIGGTGASDNDWVVLQQPGGAAPPTNLSASRFKRQTGLTAVTITAKYKAVSGTAEFEARYLRILPVRIG